LQANYFNKHNLFKEKTMKKTITLFCILFILGISTFAFPLSKASANSSAVTCTINLVANTQNCGGISNITFVVPPTGGKTVVKLNMNPDEYLHARFEVTYGSAPTGWTVNIGDSATNDGYGGDSGTQSRDAEMQVVNTSMAVYGSDHYSTPGGLYASFSNVATTSYPLVLDVQTEYLKWGVYVGSTVIRSPCSDTSLECALFALGYPSDQRWETEGQVNDDLYAAFNRVINGDYRSGSGVSRVIITLDNNYDDGSTLKSGPSLVDH